MGTPDFFRSRLDQMIDLRHPLAVLSTRLPWGSIEAAVAPKLVHQAKPPKRLAAIASSRCPNPRAAREWTGPGTPMSDRRPLTQSSFCLD